jgi:hypothetical protein
MSAVNAHRNGNGRRPQPNARLFEPKAEDLKALGLPPVADAAAAAPHDKARDHEGPDLPDPVVRPWPAPPASAAYCGLAGEFVRRIEPHYEGDPVAVLVQFLVAFGSLVGRSAWTGHWLPEPHRANLYCVLVGDTSSAGKGVGWDWTRTMMAKVDAVWDTDHRIGCLTSGEGMIEHIHGLGHDKRLLSVETEFSRLLKAKGRENNTLCETLRQAWNGDDLQLPTRKCKLPPARESHFSLIGHITGTELLARMTELDARNGVGNRPLWVCVRRTKELPRGGGGVRDVGPLLPKLRAAAEDGQRAGELRFTRQAGELWDAGYHGLSTRPPNKYGALTARARAQALRLSLVYALLDRSEQIEEAHLRAALALWDYCDRSVLYLFGNDVGTRDAELLLDALRAAGPQGMNATEVSALFNRNKTEREKGIIFAELEDAGLARRGTAKSGGRPRKVWYAVEAEGNGAPLRTNEKTKKP